jgi:hypothetical protein
MPCWAIWARSAVPVEGGGVVHLDVPAALVGQHLHGVLREDALGPERALVRGVAAALLRQFGRCPVGVVGNGFHRTVGELDRLAGGVRDAHLVQAVLEAHDPMPTGRCLKFELRALLTA